MSFLQLVLLLDKMKDGFNSILPIVSILTYIATTLTDSNLRTSDITEESRVNVQMILVYSGQQVRKE